MVPQELQIFGGTGITSYRWDNGRAASAGTGGEVVGTNVAFPRLCFPHQSAFVFWGLWKLPFPFSSLSNVFEQAKVKPGEGREFSKQGEERRVPKCAWANPPSKGQEETWAQQRRAGLPYKQAGSTWGEGLESSAQPSDSSQQTNCGCRQGLNPGLRNVAPSRCGVQVGTMSPLKTRLT